MTCWLSFGYSMGRDIDLAHDANRCSNRLRDALVSISPALERAMGDRLGQAGIRDLLSRYSTPTLLRQAGKARIKRAVSRRSPRIADKVTAAVWEALESQASTLPAEQRWGQIIADLAADLERINNQRAALETQIEEVFLKHPLAEVLVSLCGFGTRTGARTLAEIGDPHRFKDGGRLAAYAGLTPVDRQSGTSIRGATKNRSGTTDSRTPCSSPRSSPHNTTHTPRPTTKRSEPKARNTTPPSPASPGAAATSSSPCSKPRPPTTRNNYPKPLDNKTGTPPKSPLARKWRSPEEVRKCTKPSLPT